MDGNFKAEHMKPKNSDQELWLMDGRGYMVTSDRYKQYLITTPNPVEVCESLEMWGGALLMAGPAVRLQQPPGSEPGKCTEKPVGSNRHWGMCMCKTWMFYSPCHGGLSKGGTVCYMVSDLLETLLAFRQVNMDYALVHAVRHAMDPQQQVITFYDINCQYSKNLARRLQANNFISLPEGLQIRPGIGLWHVHGHQTECFARYAPNFIPAAGRVDGEIMETLWSSLNVVSPSARGMATPHRQELLDFQMNDSNFLKMVRMHKW